MFRLGLGYVWYHLKSNRIEGALGYIWNLFNSNFKIVSNMRISESEYILLLNNNINIYLLQSNEPL